MTDRIPTGAELFGLLAEFDSPDRLIAAAEKTRAAGYRRIDAYTPYPIEELSEALGLGRSKLPAIVAIGALIGLIGGFGLCYWASVIEYPLNVGGRPLNSWPAFLPVTFETTILVASLFAVLGMFALNNLPMPYHPVFNVERFALASRDRYFLVVAADDPEFDREATRRFLAELAPTDVFEVEP